MKIVFEIRDSMVDAVICNKLIQGKISEEQLKEIRSYVNTFIESGDIVDERYFQQRYGLQLKIAVAKFVIDAALLKKVNKI